MASGALGKVDQIYRSLLLTKFFTKGWGCPENMRSLLEFRKILSSRESCLKLVDKNHPVHIDKISESGDCQIYDGHFVSPFAQLHPHIMPESAQIAKFQMVLPLNWTHKQKPVCIHLAGTGDHGFWRRRTFMGRPLVKEAQIASILLENPYYGCRKPKEQVRSSLQNVSDLFVMGGALVLESIVLLQWCERMGFGPLGITGVSMGGHMASAAACIWPNPISLVPCLSWSTASQCFTQMASLAASCWPKPLSFIPCLSWSTASSVWTQGVLSGAVSWEELQDQYDKNPEVYENELAALMSSPEQHRWHHMFELGQVFAQSYPDSVDEMEKLQNETTSSSSSSNSSSSGTVLPVITQVVQKFTLKSNNPQLERSRERLKELQLDSPNLPNKYISPEVLHFMRGVMDECTHLAHFDKPVDPSLIISVAASQDAYIPRDRVCCLTDIWPGCEVRYIDQGHVTAFLFKQNEFRKAIKDSFDRQIKKYYKNISKTLKQVTVSVTESEIHIPTQSGDNQHNIRQTLESVLKRFPYMKVMKPVSNTEQMKQQ